MAQVIQIVGALLILGAFAAQPARRMPTDSRLYLALNLVGSAILAVLALVAASGLRPARGRLGDRLRPGASSLILGEEAGADRECTIADA